MTMLRSLARFVLFALLTAPLQAQITFPDSPQGKTLKDYFDAFNSGDTSRMKSFFLNHISKQGLAERPAEMRVARMAQVRADAKSLTPGGILFEGNNSARVVAKNGNGDPLTLTFEFDPVPGATLAGIRIELGRGESAPGGPPLTRKEAVDGARSYLAGEVKKDAFSGAVLVQRGNDVLVKEAYGEADKRFHVKNRPDTKFNIGSINKYMTRVAIGRLLEQGKLSLTDPVGKIWPDYPNAAVAQKVTIQHLLTMRSGMGDFFGPKFDRAAKDEIRSLRDYLPYFVNDSLGFEPGTSERYSNAGFILLGLLIEKITGEDYYAYMQEHVFEPAGMKNTGWYSVNSVTPNMATGYLHPDGDETSWINNAQILPGRGSSAGGGYTTLDDLKLFVQGLLHGKLLSAKYSEWVVNGNVPATDPPLPLKEGGMGIAGGTAGVNAALEFNAATGDIIIVLSNYGPPTAESAARELRGLMKRYQPTTREPSSR